MQTLNIRILSYKTLDETINIYLIQSILSVLSSRQMKHYFFKGRTKREGEVYLMGL